nr:hypothetical protein AXX05_01975 [Tsukamurella tyrosinosolvens]
MMLTLTPEQIAALLELLGLPADTSDPQAVLDTVESLTTAEDVAAGKPSAVAAAAGKLGLQVLDVDTYTQLKAQAAEGVQIKAAAAKAKIKASVDEAIDLGKITPARREHWERLIEADPGMSAVLASVAPNTAVPMTESGHSVQPLGEEDAADWVR